MNKPTSLQPILTIDLKKNRIRIHKQTLHLLGDPEYIQLLVNPDARLIAIRRSVRKDHLAHRVTLTNSICYELCSTELIQTLQRVKTDLETKKTYRIYGKYNVKECVAHFDMNALVLINDIQEA